MATNRILKVTAGGEIQFFEPSGPQKVSLKAPALAADFALTLPTALPGSTLGLQVDVTGAMSYSSGSGDGPLQAAYDLGEDVTLTAGKSILLTQPLNEAAFAITKSGVGAGRLFTLTDAGTGGAASIVQNGDGSALLIAKAGGAQPIVDISGTGVISGTAIKVAMPSGGSGRGIDLAQSGSGVAAYITKTAGSEPIIDIVGAGVITGAGIRMSMGASATGKGIDIDQLGTGIGLQVQKTGGSNPAVDIVGVSTLSGAGARITMPAAGSGIGLDIIQAGSGIGVRITQSTAALGLSVLQSAAAGAATFAKTGSANGTCVAITHAGNAGTALSVTTTNAVLVADFIQGNEAYVIHVRNTNAGCGSSALKITRASTTRTHYDIEGTDVNWGMTRYGNLVMSRFCVALSTNYTIATGAITIFAANDGAVISILTEAGAGTDDLDTITMSYAATGLPIIVLKAADDAKSIVVKDHTGNLHLNGADMTLDNVSDRLVLLWDSSSAKWCELSRANNGT